MKRTVTEVFFMILAVLLGIFCGLTLAFALSPKVTFWIGCLSMIVGGGIGYFAFEWNKVKIATKHAFVEVIPTRYKTINTKFRQEWPNNKNALWIIAGAILTFVYFNGILIYDLFGTRVLTGGLVSTFILSMMLSILGMTLQFGFCMNAMYDKKNLQNVALSSRKYLKYGNPIIFPFTAIYWIVVAIIKTVVFLQMAVPAIWRWLKQVIKEIHSEKRFIAATSAAIAVGFGYFIIHDYFYGLLFGSIVGIACLLFQYYVIAITWLKLKPV